MRISDWSSDVCSSDLVAVARLQVAIEPIARRDRIDEQGATDRVPAEQSALRTFQNLNRGEIVLRRGADIGGEGNVREIADDARRALASDRLGHAAVRVVRVRRRARSAKEDTGDRSLQVLRLADRTGTQRIGVER